MDKNTPTSYRAAAYMEQKANRLANRADCLYLQGRMSPSEYIDALMGAGDDIDVDA